jgi:hemolysin III
MERVMALFIPDESELIEHYPSRAERDADWWVHAIGLSAAVIGGIALLLWSLKKGAFGQAAATSLYALCLIAMLSASAAYNLTRPSKARRLLRRLDEAGIFLLIAGSCTPFAMIRLDMPWSGVLVGVVWTLALGGAAAKVFLPQVSERVWCGVYVAFGWLAAAVVLPMISGLPFLAVTLLAVGGLTYSVGVVFFLNERLPFRRAVWHCFVVAGAAAHYGAIATGVVLA